MFVQRINHFHFHRCVCGILKEKLVVLVTHQVHFALQANQILALKEVWAMLGRGGILYYKTCQ